VGREILTDLLNRWASMATVEAMTDMIWATKTNRHHWC